MWDRRWRPQQGEETVTPSPPAYIFSLENAVFKDSYRRTWQQHQQSPCSFARILTGSVLQRESKRDWARSYSAETACRM